MLTVLTIIKTVIGAAILTIPFTLSKMGFVFGSIAFAGAAVLSQLGSVLLLRSKNLCKHSNYSSIFYEIWRSRAAKGLGSLLIALGNVGVCSL